MTHGIIVRPSDKMIVVADEQVMKDDVVIGPFATKEDMDRWIAAEVRRNPEFAREMANYQTIDV